MAVGDAERSEVKSFKELELVELLPNSTDADKEVVIQAVYRQVLGNAYVMESERLAVPESQLKQGEITVREFVRQVAKSELYRSRFFDDCYRYRATEMNFKHLLGRAPDGYEEMAAHSQTMDEGGFEADIDSYVDSLEYQEKFGENIVPYHLGFMTQAGQKNVGFNRMFQLYRGHANSDRVQNKRSARLTWEVVTNTASPIYPPSAGAVTGTAGGGRDQLYRIRLMQAASPFSPVVRRSVAELLVPYEQLSSKLQQLNRQGKKVMSITEA